MSRFIRMGNAGIRGIVGSGLNLRRASNYSSAIATWLDGGKVVIGCDTRFSTPMLKSIAMSSFMAAGCDIIDAGMTPAPLVHYLVPKLNAVGGCLVGASHHGLGWNAIMPINSTGASATEAEHQSILNILHSRQFTLAEWDKLGKIEPVPRNLINEYIDEIYSDINFKAIQKANFTVVIDCCNGSASTLIRKIFEKCGVKLIVLNDELKGYLPHDPEPRPRTAYQTKALVEALCADIGFVLNTDASRVSFVTSAGEPLSEELTFPLLANAYLEKFSGKQTVITNVCTTRSLDRVVEKHGGELIKTRVGQSAAVENMQEIKALMAGDGMGSVAFNGKVQGFDAFRCCLLMLETMALQDKSSATLINELPRFHIHKSKIPCDNARAYSVLQNCHEFFDEPLSIDDTDGVRLDWEDGWIHMRVSETEPVLRLITEWPSREIATAKAEEVKRVLMRSLLHE